MTVPLAVVMYFYGVAHAGHPELDVEESLGRLRLVERGQRAHLGGRNESRALCAPAEGEAAHVEPRSQRVHLAGREHLGVFVEVVIEVDPAH
jgi:hypothetical protein